MLVATYPDFMSELLLCHATQMRRKRSLMPHWLEKLDIFLWKYGAVSPAKKRKKKYGAVAVACSGEFYLPCPRDFSALKVLCNFLRGKSSLMNHGRQFCVICTTRVERFGHNSENLATHPCELKGNSRSIPWSCRNRIAIVMCGAVSIFVLNRSMLCFFINAYSLIPR